MLGALDFIFIQHGRPSASLDAAAAPFRPRPAHRLPGLGRDQPDSDRLAVRAGHDRPARPVWHERKFTARSRGPAEPASLAPYEWESS